MEIISNNIVSIYFGINLFCAGYYFSDNFKHYNSLTEKIYYIFITICTGLIGCIYIPLAIIYGTFVWILKYLDDILLFRFWFFYFFTKRYHEMTEFQLNLKNRIIKNHSKSNSIRHRHERYAMKLINKKNNFIYDLCECDTNTICENCQNK